jgi:acyl carrier protein
MTTSNEILSRLIRVAGKKLGANLTEEDLRDARRLDEVLALDSIALLKFALGLEHEFGITLEGEFLDKEFLLDLGRLTAYLEQCAYPEKRGGAIAPRVDSR